MSDNETNNQYDWSRFIQRVNIKKTAAQKIYQLCSTQDGLEKWFLRKSIFTGKDGKVISSDHPVQAGDQYEWYWYGWDDNMVEKGTILEANGKDRFKFSFGKAGDVTFSIKTEQNETILELLQENIPTDEKSKVYYHIGCTKGWVFFLTNLKSLLEGGIDMRNRNVALRDVITA